MRSRSPRSTRQIAEFWRCRGCSMRAGASARGMGSSSMAEAVEMKALSYKGGRGATCAPNGKRCFVLGGGVRRTSRWSTGWSTCRRRGLSRSPCQKSLAAKLMSGVIPSGVGRAMPRARRRPSTLSVGRDAPRCGRTEDPRGPRLCSGVGGHDGSRP